MWIETDSFTASDAAAFDEFGRSVALSGDLAIVGAWLNDDVGDSSGSAYVFGVVGGDCDGNGQSDACVSLFDWTGDELIALDDFSGFVDCSAGANLPPDPDHLACVPSCLLAFDADADGDVDLLDWAAFQVALDR